MAFDRGESTAGTAAPITIATAVGTNLVTLPNPSAVTFLRVNADNTVSALSASAFRTAIGTGTGDVIGPSSATDNAIVRFDGTTGKLVQNSAVTINDTTGSLNFTATGARITGDFSNATIANRVAFQTSTTNGNTGIYILPNGTGNVATTVYSNNSDTTNSSTFVVGTRNSGTEAGLNSSIQGTGTYLPMTFLTGGSERMRIDTSGNVAIGTNSPSAYGKFAVVGSGDIGVFSNALNSDLRINIGTSVSSITNTQNAPLTFGTNNAERMRIDSSGNVGIGTSSPGSTLDVKGTLRLSGSSSGYVGFSPSAAAGSTTYTLPSADGSSGQFLSTNGSGTLSWATGINSSSSNTFTAAQTFRAANAIRSEAASTQDAIIVAGRAGGTSSYAVTLTPATLSASRTLTLPNNSGTVLTTGATITVAQGGTNASTAADARTNLGATTVGGNLFTLTNPSAITFPRFNADNTVSALTATDFRTAIGAGTGSGTVTGVTATSPVASSGGTAPVISLSSGYGDTQNPYASKTANYFLAAPDGTAGAPTFRAIVAADIPTLNQNTTGTASNVTGTVAVANGGTGQTSYTDGQLLIGNTSTGGLSKATLTAGSNITITNGNGSITIASTGGGGGGSGTVTSVDMSVPTGFAISGNPITTSGTLALTYASGYSLPTTTKQSEWDTAYTDRLKWDGGSTGLVVSTARTSILPSYTGNGGKVLAVNTGATDIEWVAAGSGSMVYPGAGIAVSTGSAWGTSLTAPTGAIVGTTDTQDLSNKTFTTATTFRAANGIRSEAAATQDAVVIAGRAGGTSSYEVTVTPTTLTADRTLTLPDASTTVVGTDTTQTLTNKTLTDPAIIGTILEDVHAITDVADFEIDPGQGSIQTITLGATRTPRGSNFAAGESVTLMVLDGTAYTLIWTHSSWGGSGVVWVGGTAPVLDTTKYTVIQLWKVGTQVYGALVGSA